MLNHTQFLGYTKGPDGILQVVPEEAEVVRKVFDPYVQGNGVRKIKRYLEEHGIKTATGKSEWSTSTIDRMLSNEKYIGEVLMQKTYIAEFLTGRPCLHPLNFGDVLYFSSICDMIFDKSRNKVERGIKR